MKLVTENFRQWLLKRLLRYDQLAVVRALEEPARWQPAEALSQKDAAGWGMALRAPLMLKIDTAMINMAHEEAQRAILAPAAELPKQAGFALGFRAGWEAAKTLSRLHVADDVRTEEPDTTASGDLDHAAP